MKQSDPSPAAPSASAVQLLERLAQTAQPDSGDGLSDLQARELLQKRALKLALTSAAPVCQTEILEIVVFRLGQERYAIASSYVQEITPLRRVTRVPGAPDFVKGVVNLHGQLLALFDLRQFFGLPANESTAASRIVVLGQECAEFGIVADLVESVSFIEKDLLKEPPDFLSQAGRDFWQAVTDDALVLLNGANLLGDGRLYVDQSAA